MPLIWDVGNVHTTAGMKVKSKTEPIHARLRLIKSENFDLCSSYKATAASPLGSAVRPCSMSLTVDGAKPTITPISESVSPVERRSETREAHVVMAPMIRESVSSRQRVSVSAFRDTMDMPRPKDMPKNIDHGPPGPRVRWWREYRKMSRKELATACAMSQTGLSDLENGRTERGSYLHLIAAKLKLNPHYVETGKGEPEAEFEQEAPASESWPLQGISKAEIEGLNPIERKYAEMALAEAIDAIKAERRKAKRSG
jgi:transcriptional regulator with XRE-family HTH domain